MVIDFWIDKLGRYVRLDVSDDGKTIRDVERDYVYKQDFNSDGYLTVRVRHVRTTVHRLVALAFLGERPAGMVIDHIDRNKANNNISNLRYCTPSENSRNVSNDSLERVRNMHVFSKSRESQILSCGKPCILRDVSTGEVFEFRSKMDAARFIFEVRKESSVSNIVSNLGRGWNTLGFKFEVKDVNICR